MTITLETDAEVALWVAVLIQDNTYAEADGAVEHYRARLPSGDAPPPTDGAPLLQRMHSWHSRRDATLGEYSRTSMAADVCPDWMTLAEAVAACGAAGWPCGCERCGGSGSGPFPDGECSRCEGSGLGKGGDTPQEPSNPDDDALSLVDSVVVCLLGTDGPVGHAWEDSTEEQRDDMRGKLFEAALGWVFEVRTPSRPPGDPRPPAPAELEARIAAAVSQVRGPRVRPGGAEPDTEAAIRRGCLAAEACIGTLRTDGDQNIWWMNLGGTGGAHWHDKMAHAVVAALASEEAAPPPPTEQPSNSEAIARDLGKAAAEHLTGPGYTIEPHDGAGGLAFTMTMDNPVEPSGVPDAPAWQAHFEAWLADPELGGYYEAKPHKLWGSLPALAQLFSTWGGRCTPGRCRTMVHGAEPSGAPDAPGLWLRVTTDVCGGVAEYAEDIYERPNGLYYRSYEQNGVGHEHPVSESCWLGRLVLEGTPDADAGLRKRVEPVLADCESGILCNGGMGEPELDARTDVYEHVVKLLRAALEVQS